MTSNDLPFVSFEPRGAGFMGFVSMEVAVGHDTDPEAVLAEAAEAYMASVAEMRALLAEIELAREKPTPIPAVTVWELGDGVFQLTERLRRLGLELDGVYDHLTRDLGVKRKWLEKAIILRRYLPEKTLIPQSLSWGRCEKGTRRVARRLAEGLPLE